MLPALIIALLLTICGSILAFPLLVLSAAFVIFIPVGQPENLSMYAGAMGLFLAGVPLAAWLSGALLDTVSLTVRRGTFFAPLGLILSSYVLFQTDAWFKALEALAGKGPHMFLNAGLEVLSAVLLSAGITAVVLSAVPLVFEVPIHWVLDEKKIRVREALQSLRPLAVLLVIAVAFRLFVDLFVQEFDSVLVIWGVV